jgi:nucleoside-diphosphate-sugar epimerase
VTWLVTGGAGFVGVHLLRRLRHEGIPARSFDLQTLDRPGLEEVRGDVRDGPALRTALRGVDVVVHAAAALPSRGRGLQSVNAEGSLAVARAARETAVRRSILVSSAVVYGLAQPPVRETDPARPIEAYGHSKLRGETAWLAEAPEPVILRPSAVVGPERLGAFGILFRWVAEGRRIYVLGGGANRYQLLDVEDLVAAIMLAGAAPVTGEIFNVGGVVSGSVRDDLESLIRHAGSSSRVARVPERPARAALAALDALRLSPLTAWHRRSAAQDVVLDCTCARSLLGWEPVHGGAEALQRAYDWFVAGDATLIGPGHTHRTAWPERALGLLRRVS